MEAVYHTLTLDTLDTEHLCCAIADRKHQEGVQLKKQWLADRIQEGHVFRKLDVKGKVFIEYAPLETAWTPVFGDRYLYIYCLWVSGQYKNQGHAKALLSACMQDAKRQQKAGICVICGKSKSPFLSDRKFFQHAGFSVVDTIDSYELLAYSFDGSLPRFTDTARMQTIHQKELTIYYGLQCPYIPNCITQIKQYCKEQSIPVSCIPIDSLPKAKAMPCVFNNWAVFYGGNFITHHLLNEGYLKKMLSTIPS